MANNEDQELKSLLQKLTDSIGGLTTSMTDLGGMAKTIGVLAGAFSSFVSDINRIQSQSISINKSLADTQRDVYSAIKDLPGGMHNLEVVFDANLAGMKNLDKSTLRLFSEIRAVGKYNPQLVSALAESAATTLMSSSQIGMLSETISKSSDSQIIASDALLTSINNLSKHVASVRILGGTGELQVAVSKFAATFPKSVQGDVDRLVRTITDTSMSTRNQFMLMGVLDQRNRVLTAKTAEGKFSAMTSLLAGIKRSADFQTTLAKGGPPAIQANLMKRIYGELGGVAMTLVQSQEKITEDQRNSMRFFTSFGALKEDFSKSFFGKISIIADAATTMAAGLSGESGSVLSKIGVDIGFMALAMAAFKSLKFLFGKASIPVVLGTIAYEIARYTGVLDGLFKSLSDFTKIISVSLRMYGTKSEGFVSKIALALADGLDKFESKDKKVGNLEANSLEIKKPVQRIANTDSKIIEEAIRGIIFSFQKDDIEREISRELLNVSKATADNTYTTSKRLKKRNIVGGY